MYDIVIVIILQDGFLFVISPCYKRESYTSVK